MKRKITFLSAALMLLAFLAVPLGMRGQTRAEEVYSTCLFGPNYNSTGVSSYTSTFTATNGDFSWIIANGNNNNNQWNYVKFGRKNNASVGSITTTVNYGQAITKVDLTIDAITADKVNSIKLYTSSDNNTWVEASSFGKATGVQTATLATPATGLYYKIELDCASGSANGLVTVSKVEYYYNSDGPSTPTITASNIELAYGATEGSIAYTINNPVDNGSIAASTESEWLYVDEEAQNTSEGSFDLLCDPNTGDARMATVTLTYTYGEESITKDVTVTQAAAPVVYTTIPDLFAAATSTETNVLVNFNSWVVSGVSTNGKNVFVTDNEGHGFVIYSSANMSETYSVGDILSGEISCTLKLYNGFAELLNVNSEDLTINEGGTLTVAAIEMADLAGVNTGALLHYDNLTCNINNNKYYLTDGTTTLQVYNSLYAFNAFTDSASYNITGIYQQFNNTKEILPRSAEDIEEVVAPAEPSITVEPATVNAPFTGADGTLTVTYENITEIVADVYFCDANGEAANYDWIDAEIDNDNNVYYMINTNDGEARTAYFKVFAINGEEFVYSNLVTVTQNAPVAPVAEGWVLTDLADLTEGDVFVIVGVYDVDESSFAMPNNSTGAPSAVEVTMVGNTLSGDIDDNLKWNLSIGENGYTFYPDGETETWLYCTNTNNGVRVGTNENNVFSMTSEGYLFNNATERYIGIYNSQDWRCYTSINNNIKEQTFAFYKRVDASEIETYTLDITGYGDSDGGYYLIASPVSMIRPTADNGFLTNDYDLYYFDQSKQDYEWCNYEAKHFNIASGKGYLYASQEDTTLTFEGIPYNGDGTISLVKDDNAVWSGWNLVGNPFGETAYIDRDFYVMNQTGSELIQSSGEIAIMQGIFVIAEEDGETLTFTTEAPTTAANVTLNLSQNRGAVIDRTIVRFSEGRQLPKFQLNAESTKLYIPQGNNDYAVVRSAGSGEMPISFKAERNGIYTLSVNAENVEASYLHLIDNMSGADIDLLVTPSYSFEAKTTDYTSRFRLVFNITSVEENTTSTESFAFFNGNEWVISNTGEATLQVVDMLGRIISSETVNGNATIATHNLTNGVYVMRLINGNDVKTQKIVVR